MIEIQRILCPSDFSEFSLRAFEVSLALAERYGGTVTALHVIPPPLALPGRSSLCLTALAVEERDRRRLDRELQRFAEPAQTTGLPVETVLEEGDVVAEILEQAEAWPADLVVMGTRGRRTSSGWAMGSVTERVLRRAPCPVLTVPRLHPAALGGRRGPFRRILCPLDFSEPSRKALDYAVSLARAYGADLTLLHVLEWFPAEQEPSRFCVPEYHLDLSQEATDRMRRVVAEEGAATCPHEELVATGRPHHEILRVAQARGVDLIALGVHGRRAVDQVLSGPTLCHVAREATCPVLAVRPQ